MKDHVVGSFDLAVAPMVGNRGVVDVDSVFLAKIPKGRASESFAQVGDDPVGNTETCVMSLMNFAASSDVTFATGWTSIHLLNLSTATSMCL
jgi:hypothetical protein